MLSLTGKASCIFSAIHALQLLEYIAVEAGLQKRLLSLQDIGSGNCLHAAANAFNQHLSLQLRG